MGGRGKATSADAEGGSLHYCVGGNAGCKREDEHSCSHYPHPPVPMAHGDIPCVMLEGDGWDLSGTFEPGQPAGSMAFL